MKTAEAHHNSSEGRKTGYQLRTSENNAVQTRGHELTENRKEISIMETEKLSLKYSDTIQQRMEKTALRGIFSPWRQGLTVLDALNK